jgi:hypothetical protein
LGRFVVAVNSADFVGGVVRGIFGRFVVAVNSVKSLRTADP